MDKDIIPSASKKFVYRSLISRFRSTTKGSTNGETLSPVYNNSSPIVGNNFNFDDKKKLEHVQTYRLDDIRE